MWQLSTKYCFLFEAATKILVIKIKICIFDGKTRQKRDE